ncbi:MAG: response regulator [Anaerolineaceae bacterium]|nr:response regulator [Anaerolineaceae bacterium]
MNILIVDDEKLIREGLKKIIQEKAPGFSVIGEACNGVEALQLTEILNPQICIVDIRMRRMDGIEFIRNVRNTNSRIRFIVLSGYEDFEYARELMPLGCTAYLTKPVKHEELLFFLKQCAEDIKKDIQNEQLKNVLVGSLAGTLKQQQIFRFSETDSISEIDLPHLRQEDRILDACINGNSKELSAAVDQLLKELQEENASLHICVVQLNRLYPLIIKKLNSQAFSFILERIPPVAAFESKLRSASGLEEVRQYTQSLFDEIAYAMDQGKKGSERNVITRAKQYISENYSKSISLVDIAEHVGLNASYFSQLFKTETGQTYMKYLTNYRIEKAKELLKDPTLKIFEVGEMVGYSDPQYFNRIFRQVVNSTPREYRDNYFNL